MFVDYAHMEMEKLGFTERNPVWIMLSQRTTQ